MQLDIILALQHPCSNFIFFYKRRRLILKYILDSMANGLVACSIEEAALGQAMASFAVTCSALPLHAATPAHKEKQKPGFA
ncbi:hypothetical protein EB796_012098 [Bugula neritina]|uniref:Uncharacterized protein n=1 Tax=Bugula neritina TaxID=10212 RepID=A0A7J7JV42_BUGNE|nr:hypothetical protein EB796_012098 [Bugula neritina]